MYHSLLITMGIGLMVACMPHLALAHEQECRRFTKEIRAGDYDGDRYGTICKQADGSWREVQRDKDSYGKGGYFIRPHDSRYYAPNTHSHYFEDRYNTRLIISEQRPPVVVVSPFYSHRYHHNRHWSPAKRAFHQHHHGSGWEKHWKHHERVLEGR